MPAAPMLWVSDGRAVETPQDFDRSDGEIVVNAFWFSLFNVFYDFLLVILQVRIFISIITNLPLNPNICI